MHRSSCVSTWPSIASSAGKGKGLTPPRPRRPPFFSRRGASGFEAEAAPARDDITRAYFRELERRPRWSEREPSPPTRDSESPGRSGVRNGQLPGTLREAGAANDTPRALLAEGNIAESDRRSTLTAHMQFVSEHDEDAFTRRNEELGYLANVLVSGCSFNSGQFSPADARDAVMSTCNLGLENWPRSMARCLERQ